jgi:hypothetical protein
MSPFCWPSCKNEIQYKHLLLYYLGFIRYSDYVRSTWMSKKVYSHTSCTLDITPLNEQAADSKLSVQFMQVTNRSRPHGIMLSHPTTPQASHSPRELQMWHNLHGILGKSNSSCNNVPIPPPPPHPKKILSQYLHQFVGIFLIHKLDARTMPSCNEGINLPLNTICVYYILFPGNMFRPSTVTDSCLQLDWQSQFLFLVNNQLDALILINYLFLIFHINFIAFSVVTII